MHASSRSPRSSRPQPTAASQAIAPQAAAQPQKAPASLSQWIAPFVLAALLSAALAPISHAVQDGPAQPSHAAAAAK